MSANLACLADAIGNLTGNELHQAAVLLSERLLAVGVSVDSEVTAVALESLPPFLLPATGNHVVSHRAAD